VNVEVVASLVSGREGKGRGRGQSQGKR